MECKRFKKKLSEHQEKREVIAELDVEPISNFFSQQVAEHQKKFNEYRKVVVNAFNNSFLICRPESNPGSHLI